MPYPIIKLKSQHSKPVLSGHPWIFSGAVDKTESELVDGALCRIVDEKGKFLAVGYYNSHSTIACRILSLHDIPIDREFLASRIVAAMNYRIKTACATRDAYRLINTEGDFLPGLIVDVYNGGLVLQISTTGMERLKDIIIETLTGLLNPPFIYERSDIPGRKLEGLPASAGLLHGKLPSEIVIREHDCRFHIDIPKGHKTGWYLDQAENRLASRQFAEGDSVLNCFSYTGGFTVHALKAGAKAVVSVDSSAEANALCERNLDLNNLKGKGEIITDDVFDYLRKGKEKFDLIILDPPPFAKNKNAVPQAARGYKDINLLALKKLNPGGVLLTFTCSQHIDDKLFSQIVFSAAADSGKEIRLIRKFGHPLDHPVNIAHREGYYLRGLALEI